MSEQSSGIASYSYEEAFEESLKYFNQDELAARVFVDKYALRSNKDELLEKSPINMHWRIAKEIARIEKNKFVNPLDEQKVFDLLDKFKKLVPQGGILYGLGNKDKYISLANCYALPSPEDSYSSIMKVDEYLVNISKRRGGTGVDLSTLRPNGSPTSNSSRTSTGVIPFANRYSNSIREVGQSGRRGAILITLSVHHPDILDFISCKKDRTKVVGANISVKITDEFIQAVKSNSKYQLRFPIDSKTPKISKYINAREVWNKIVESAHDSAEPGVLFWDTMLRESIPDCYSNDGFNSVCCNVCSELNLGAFGSCLLMVINIYSYITNPFTKNAYFDSSTFYKDAKLAQRIMDDIVDLEIEYTSKIIDKIKNDPESNETKQTELNLWIKIQEVCKNGRRIGIGLTGLADAIAAMGLKYGTEESIKLARELYQTLKFACYESSIEIAKELGPFPIFNDELEKNNPFLNRLKSESITIGNSVIKGSDLWNDMRHYGRRNISLLTSSPAGTVSLLTQTSSAIEPVFELLHTRKKKVNSNDNNARVDSIDKVGDKWTIFKVTHPQYEYYNKLKQENPELIIEDPYIGSCANDINWLQRIKLQSAIQHHICHCISSTINLPSTVDVETISNIYLTAYDNRCKGITVYRDKSREGVLTRDNTKSSDRPREIPCQVHHVTVRGNEYFVLIGMMDGRPYEVFAGRNGFLDKNKIKSGKIIRKRKGFYKAIFDDDEETEIAPCTINCTDSENAITRLVSLSLQNGVSLNKIVTQLEKVPGDLTSYAKSIARALKRHIPDGTSIDGEVCPECGSNITRFEGCWKCVNCSYSKCS